MQKTRVGKKHVFIRRKCSEHVFLQLRCIITVSRTVFGVETAVFGHFMPKNRLLSTSSSFLRTVFTGIAFYTAGFGEIYTAAI